MYVISIIRSVIKSTRSSRSFQSFLPGAILSFLVVATGCDNEDPERSRSFYMGFTPFPHAVSQEAVNFTYTKLASDGDIVNHHFDNGVPWAEALNNEPFHNNITNDWSFRKNNTPAGLKTYVSVTPLNIDRNGLARYRGEAEEMPLSSPWNTYNFTNTEVKTAYLNYCKRIIDFFNPDFFNMTIEANLLYLNNTTQWSDFLVFHAYIYQQLKQTYPDLVIFSSVSGAHMLENAIADNDPIQQRLAVLQLLEHSDWYALSFYPYLTGYLGNPYPENTFDVLFSISEKPLAIAETGYTAQSFTINIGGGEIAIVSDQTRQNKYIQDLLNACEKHKAKFVINFVLRDYDDLWQTIGGKNDLSIAWRDTGLYDEAGNPRAAYATWKDYFSGKYESQ